MPSLPSTKVDKAFFDYEAMPHIKRVIDYSGLNYNEALDLECDLFMLMVKNSIVDEMKSTEEGRAYLEKCERLNKTEMDFDALTKHFDVGGME